MEYYAKLENARAIRDERREVRTDVESWWQSEGWQFPPLPEIWPAGYLVHQIATARYEDCVFVAMAQKAGLLPVWGQYIEDKFATTVSNLKRSYVVGQFCSGRGRKGGPKTDRHEYLRLANHSHPKYEVHRVIDEWRGRKLSEITDPSTGENLVTRHNAFQDRTFGIDASRRFDISAFYKQGEPKVKAEDYYPRYLSIFVGHGVLFEDYHGGESGAELGGFTETVFEPAFKEVRERFGVCPLIVPLPWWPELAYYPHPDAGDCRTHGFFPPEFF